MEDMIKKIDQQFEKLLATKSVAQITEDLGSDTDCCPYDLPDLVIRLNSGGMLSAGQKRWILQHSGKTILIFSALDDCGISKKSIAYLCGVSTETVRLWSNGTSPLPKLAEEKLKQLLALFGEEIR